MAYEPASVGHVALSRFEVVEGWSEEVVAAFRARPHLVERAPGFVRLDVLRPVDTPSQFWLITYWTDEQSFRSWHGEYRIAAHQGMPAGLRLVPGSFELAAFEHVTA